MPHLLLLDNYDSFTYNLLDYFQQLQLHCTVWRNDACTLTDIEQLQPDLLVISPGPKTPAVAGLTMPLIQHFHQQIPILGICLGHQAIGEYFGAKLVKAPHPMHGMTSTLYTFPHPIFKGLPAAFQVMRYHSLCLQEVEDTPLQVISQTIDNIPMSIIHKSLPIIGLQFHPESILTPFGLPLLQNIVDFLLDFNAPPPFDDPLTQLS